jgi:hypothetical protein
MPASGATPVVARSSEAGFGATCISGVSAINSAQLPSWTVGFACKRTEDLVAHRIAIKVRADCFDGARVVAAEDDGKVVVDHFPQHPRRDRVVDGVDRGGAHAHNHAAGRGGRIGQIVAHGRSGVEGIEGDGSHQDLLSCWGQDKQSQ